MDRNELTSSRKRKTAKKANSMIHPLRIAGGAYGHALRNALFPNLSGYFPARSASCPAIRGLAMAATLKEIGSNKKA